MTSPALTYIVVNLNGGPLLAEALESIARQTLADHEVIVVDNGSTDRSWDLPVFRRPGWRLERLDRNVGFAEANNLAAGFARGALLALVNNDVTLACDWAEKVIAAFADPDVAAVATRLLQKRDPSRLDSAGFDAFTCGATTSWRDEPANRFHGRDHEPFGPVASAAAYRRTAFETVGGFHAEYFAYYEDTDLAMRLRLHGLRTRYLEDAVGHHLGSATGSAQSDFQRYHLRRNIELLYWTNMVGALALKHLPAHLVYEAAVFAAMAARGQAGVFLKAKRDAVRMAGWIWKARRALRERLRADGALRDARARLESGVKPTWEALGRAGNLEKILRRPAR